MHIPRVLISGTHGGAGKTTVCLGLARALADDKLTVHPFKKGPDYIDTAWLAKAARRAASNLDLFFLEPCALRAHFLSRSHNADVAVIEGNRGFYDGRDLAGSSSTEAVARWLDAPVVLVVDITKMTRTVAALVHGFTAFPGGKRIAGVILNRSGGERHAALARRAVEELAGVRVFGVLPRVDMPFIHERRMGLVTVDMHEAAEESLARTAAFFREHVDVASILALARSAPELEGGSAEQEPASKTGVRIGVVRDAAFWQYYDENLEALEKAGAELVFLSLLDTAAWPCIDGLYIGGGDIIPYVEALAGNVTRKRYIRNLVEEGMPVYAEQMGCLYLGESFVSGGVHYPMAGIFPLNAQATQKPGQLGYVDATVLTDSLFYPKGTCVRGHEYYYAKVCRDTTVLPVFRHELRSKTAVDAQTDDEPRGDGILRNAAFGSCMQIFAPAVPQWAPSFVRSAAAWRGATR